MELYVPYYGFLDWFGIGSLAPGLVEARGSPLDPGCRALGPCFYWWWERDSNPRPRHY